MGSAFAISDQRHFSACKQKQLRKPSVSENGIDMQCGWGPFRPHHPRVVVLQGQAAKEGLGCGPLEPS